VTIDGKSEKVIVFEDGKPPYTIGDSTPPYTLTSEPDNYPYTLNEVKPDKYDSDDDGDPDFGGWYDQDGNAWGAPVIVDGSEKKDDWQWPRWTITDALGAGTYTPTDPPPISVSPTPLNLGNMTISARWAGLKVGEIKIRPEKRYITVVYGTDGKQVGGSATIKGKFIIDIYEPKVSAVSPDKILETAVLVTDGTNKSNSVKNANEDLKTPKLTLRLDGADKTSVFGDISYTITGEKGRYVLEFTLNVGAGGLKSVLGTGSGRVSVDLAVTATATPGAGTPKTEKTDIYAEDVIGFDGSVTHAAGTKKTVGDPVNPNGTMYFEQKGLRSLN
jgi:hypothetical protein